MKMYLFLSLSMSSFRMKKVSGRKSLDKYYVLDLSGNCCKTIRYRCCKPRKAFGQCQWIHLRESLLSSAVERLEGYRSFHRGTVDLPPCVWITESRVATSLGENAGCDLSRHTGDL